MTRWRRAARGWMMRPFNALTPDQRFWIGFGLLSLVTTLLIHNPLWSTSNEYSYREGEVARESIIAPADIYYIDEAETEKIRQSAEESV
ncbi:MAG TPA: hypothetical protein VHL50_00755, partial [Pyrinomonadaceae bacterium]|nr:hypothetical protein [Pyrinomonadaceae bacterium]